MKTYKFIVELDIAGDMESETPVKDLGTALSNAIIYYSDTAGITSDKESNAWLNGFCVRDENEELILACEF